MKMKCEKARDLQDYLTMFRTHMQVMAAADEPIADGMAVGLLRTQLAGCGLANAPLAAFAMLPQEQQRTEKLLDLLERLVYHYKASRQDATTAKGAVTAIPRINDRQDSAPPSTVQLDHLRSYERSATPRGP